MIGQGSPRRLFVPPLVLMFLVMQTAPGVFAQSPNRPEAYARPTPTRGRPLLADAPMPGSRLGTTELPGETMRVRFAWGGGESRIWNGRITIDGGSFSRPRTLGIESDRSCRLTHDQKSVAIAQQSARAYDGLDLSVIGPLDAVITIRLTTADKNEPTTAESPSKETRFTLADLITDEQTSVLDTVGNRLVVQRSPGDRLRVEFSRKSLVFSPREKFAMRVRPHRLHVAANRRLRLQAELVEARGGDSVWSQSFDLMSTTEGIHPENTSLSLEMPDREGSYDLVLTIYKWGFRQRFNPASRIAPGKPLAQRAIQMIVLHRQAPRPPLFRKNGLADENEQLVTELDPANPGWWQRIARLPQMSHVPGVPRGPWNNGKMRIWDHPRLGRTSRLAKDGWSAFLLPIDTPGKPHILEIDYATDAPMALGISVIEPNAAGEVVPIGLDSGLYVEKGTTQPGRGWSKHRLIFWPRTTAPTVLLTNRHDSQDAVHGKIRVLSTKDQLSRAVDLTESNRAVGQPPGRMITAYMDRPLLPENFHASESTDWQGGRSLDDWVTFHQAGTRLVEYLHHVGNDGIMLGVVADGSTIYPTSLIDSTPRYDTGAFFSSGQDPVRKDVLEMLFRLFDRQGLKLIPAISFDAPLREVEALLAERGITSTGIVPIGPNGQPLPTGRAGSDERPIRYNALNRHVQQAMLNVVRELLERYGHHRSFGGLTLQLSGDGFLVLPGPLSSLDDATIAAFERDTGLVVAGKGAERFAVRANALAAAPLREKWLKWRASRLTDFHAQAVREVMAVDADAKLYIAAGRIFEDVRMSRRLRPSLTHPENVTDALLEIGIDVSLYQKDRLSNVVFLRPRRIASRVERSTLAVNAMVNRSDRLDQLIARTATPGELFYHQPMTLRSVSFDKQSPYGSDKTYTWLVSQMSPSAESNRRRFIHALAKTDPLMMFDGGWMIPLGQEESLRTLADVYRRLPAKRFLTVNAKTLPVTIRKLTDASGTIVYLVNDSPWETTVEMHLDASADCRIRPLSPMQDVGRLASDDRRWRVKMRPYDLVAARLSDAQARITRATTSLDRGAKQELTARVRKLTEQVSALSRPMPLDLLKNPGFELPTVNGAIPGWLAKQTGNGIDIGLVRKSPKTNGQAISIRSDGPKAWVISEWFSAGRTGRLAIQLALRTDDDQHQPQLRVGLESRSNGIIEYRWAPVGAKPARTPLPTKRRLFIFPFDNLPIGKSDELRICLDLIGAGNVTVDDVKLFNLHFDNNELGVLSKVVTLANMQLGDDNEPLSNENLAQCAEMLDGYWPQFLLENAPTPPPRQAKVPDPHPSPEKDAPQKKAEKGFFERWSPF